jgi:hypothetical protein
MEFNAYHILYNVQYTMHRMKCIAWFIEYNSLHIMYCIAIDITAGRNLFSSNLVIFNFRDMRLIWLFTLHKIEYDATLWGIRLAGLGSRCKNHTDFCFNIAQA